MMNTLASTIWAPFAAGKKDDFFVTAEGRISYRDAAKGIAAWLAVFDGADLAPGDRVICRTGRDEVAAIVMIAAIVDGVVPVILDASSPDEKLVDVASLAEPKLVISDSDITGLPADVSLIHVTTQPAPKKLWGLGRATHSLDFGVPATDAPRVPRLPQTDGLAYLLFTSGTTAAPSGVAISRTNLAANLATLTRLFDYGPTARIFNDMMLAHADGMVQGPVLAAYCQGAVIRAGGFEVNRVEDWLATACQTRATHVIAVPTVWAMIDRYAKHDDYFNAAECQSLQSCAAALPAPLWDRLESRFGHKIASHYGLTETVVSALYSGDVPGLGTRQTLGIPVDCTAKIAGDASEGELLLKGDNVFDGYWRNPERTAESFTPDGWFRTGDIATTHADGSFRCIGRLKTAIVSGGILIRPEEIDHALQRHPAVAESATVGIADDLFGEVVASAIVVSEPVSEEELADHLRSHLEKRKVPRHIFELDKIPRGPSGKPQISELREVLVGLIGIDGFGPSEAENIESGVLEVAARVFRVDPETVTLHSGPDQIEGWDSFTQLNLVLSLERYFDCDIEARMVSQIRSLGDAVKAVKAARS